jgi:homoserine O-acetyltransferase
MSDPLNVLAGLGRLEHDPPDSPRSVGWTRPHRVRLVDESDPLPLDCGETFFPIDVEYETYGQLNPALDNAILVCHALSGDAHAAGWDAGCRAEGRPWRCDRPGWWDAMIGPGKALDTSRYFVVCMNNLGSCYGTTGPASTDPGTGRPYGMEFPVITVGDWVRLQERLVTRLGVQKLFAVTGGSLGGQQAIEWALAYPDRVRAAVVFASAPRLSTQGVAFNTVARHAIRSDPHFRAGAYLEGGPSPDHGLAAARMIGHITYLSEVSMARKFGRRTRDVGGPSFGWDAEYEVESYLAHQGAAFVERFDAASYLYMTKAMDYYDAAAWGNGDLAAAACRATCSWLAISFTSDWLYAPARTRDWVGALAACHKPVSYVSIESSYGHDAFLLEVDRITRVVTNFLAALRRNL